MRFIDLLVATAALVALATPPATALQSNSSTAITTTTSTLRPAIERVFSRQRRFLLLPKGASFKVTAQFTKRLLALVPRGFNFVIELAFYYPCPSSRIELIPKRLRQPTTTTPKPWGPPTPPLLVYIPGTEIRYKAKPAARPQIVQRIDEAGGAIPLRWIESTGAANGSYAQPQKWAQWSKYGTPQYQKKYEWTPAQRRPTWRPSAAQQTKWTKWATTPPAAKWRKWQQQEQQQQQQRRRWSREAPYEDAELPAYRPMYFADLEEHAESPHYHSHRDRRQLLAHFDALGKFLGIDMKSCVLRAVCESKLLLLPPGYSMLQDILRLIFTFPTISGLTDEYSRLMQSDFATCHRRLRRTCSISLLSWLLQPQAKVEPTLRQ